MLLACLLGGLLLLVIGVRYMLVPEAAALTFGIRRRPQAFELHYVTGLRNMWLGGLAVALAAFREWRALALWFGMAAIVCLADAGIAAGSVGGWPHIAFHAGCGVASAGLSALCWRAAAKGS
ncbi:MAG: DUF4267 domain-containing protein [Hyphomicrobiaceae bacterium]|nr:DUF4267 domain-containing protein [Hyphomicrobiaceae bacterium]